MLAADAELDVGPRLAAPRDADFDEFADAFLIDRDEGILVEDAARRIGAEEGAGIVARNAERRSGSGHWCRRRRIRRVSAILSACRQARGNSIIVPTV